MRKSNADNSFKPMPFRTKSTYLVRSGFT